jgi:hypothetical protein
MKLSSFLIAAIALISGTARVNASVVSPNTNLNSRELEIVAASRGEATPRFNGAAVVGVRSGTPFIHSFAVR